MSKSTLIFDEKTALLLREATALAAQNAKTKINKRRYIELSEHIFLAALLNPGTFKFDGKKGVAIKKGIKK